MLGLVFSVHLELGLGVELGLGFGLGPVPDLILSIIVQSMSNVSNIGLVLCG